MYLAQARNIPGIHVVGIADINIERAKGALKLVDWPADAITVDVDAAIANRTTAVIPDAAPLFDADLDVIVEATGNPIVGVDHALRAIGTGKHIIMVTVEADALAGPALARRAKEAGVVYSMAYGDQPALIMELVDWARASGFDVACAGKGAKYLEHYHEMNPDNVWDNWEFSKELTNSGQLNPYMHTSFRDGTKAAIEMAAVANAAGLTPSDEGLTFTPGNVEEIATICRPSAVGGVLARDGSVDVMSSVTRDGEWIPFNTQEGVFVVVKATNRYVSGCFTEYPWHPDPTGQYAALYRPYHYVGLELNISIANAVLRGVATGSPTGFYGDVVATAKKDLTAGDVLDGEGGYTVWGKLMTAGASASMQALPIGLAHGVKLKRDIAAGKTVTWNDVEYDASSQAVRIRREMESELAVRDAAALAT
jgi:predicted homoserine dehydrogenase-like protein